jgi:glycosyltransferase involved in cell wall biosynthesis
MRMFRLQAGRLAALRAYDRIVTASEHMRQEYLRHGFAPEAVHAIIPPIEADTAGCADKPENNLHPTAGWRLVFAGRMTHLKGGPLLLDALSRVSAAVDAPVTLTFVGDGQARPEWEARAKALMARDRNIHVEFTGWLSGAEFDSVVRRAHLHVMPSVWPEPFGRSGPELAASGLPSAAFAVGGVPEWLRDGFNGFLASADPPTSEGLADAILRCLVEKATYLRLRAGAIESAKRFSLEAHIADLERVFGEAASHRAAAGAADSHRSPRSRRDPSQ